MFSNSKFIYDSSCCRPLPPDDLYWEKQEFKFEDAVEYEGKKWIVQAKGLVYGYLCFCENDWNQIETKNLRPWVGA